MSAPTNLSLNGIVTWAEGFTAQGSPPPNSQNINADRLDGYHAADILAAAQAMGGGGVVAMGSTTFAGSGGYKTITFSPILPSTTYAVYIVPDAATSSRVGEYWVTNKTTNSFRVYNAGTGATSFQWAVAVLGQMPDLAGPASGDISGTHPGPYTVTRMQGRNISSSAPSTGQVLTWNGSSWAPAAASGGGSGSVVLMYSRAGSGGLFSTYLAPGWRWSGQPYGSVYGSTSSTVNLSYHGYLTRTSGASFKVAYTIIATGDSGIITPATTVVSSGPGYEYDGTAIAQAIPMPAVSSDSRQVLTIIEI